MFVNNIWRNSEGEFDRFEKAFDHEYYQRGYSGIHDFFEHIGSFFYHNMLTIAVYASFIAVIITAAALVMNATNRIKLGEAKQKVLRVFIVSVLIFAVTGLVQIFIDLGMKW